MHNILLFTLALLMLPLNHVFSQDSTKRFDSITELLRASRQLKPGGAELLLKSADVVSIAKAQMKNGKPHYLGDARYAIQFPGLFGTFSSTLQRGKNYTLVGPTDAIDSSDPWLKVRYAESDLAFRYNLAMFHFDNAKNKHLEFTKSLEDTRVVFEIPKNRWTPLPLISKLKMQACCTDYKSSELESSLKFDGD